MTFPPASSPRARHRPRPRAGWVRTQYGASILIVLAVGPALYLGGAPRWSAPLWTSLALVALATTGLHWRELRRDYLVRAALLAMLIACIQLVPLPPFALRFLDPRSADLSAGALSPLRIDRASHWRALSMDPGNTVWDLEYALGLVAAYIAAKRATIHGYRDRLLAAVRAGPLILATLALVHQAMALDRVYGLYEPVEARPPILSPVLNPNHLAAICGVGVVLWVATAVFATGLFARLLSLGAAAACAVVCALSRSRGGIAATAGALLVLLVLSARVRGPHGRSRSKAILAPAISVGSVVSAALYVGWEAVQTEYATGDLTKLAVFRRSVAPILHHWLLGCGSGGVGAAVNTEHAMPVHVTMARAENLPLDLTAAFGLPCAIAVLVLGWRWLRHVNPTVPGRPPETIGPYCAMLSLAAHDMFDFALWMPATGFLAAVLAGWLSGSVRDAAEPRERGRHRALLAAAVVANVLIAPLVAVSPLTAARDRAAQYVRNPGLGTPSWNADLIRHPGDAYVPLAGAYVAIRQRDSQSLRFIARAMLVAPAWGEPHAMLARALISHGYYSQGYLEIRSVIALQPTLHEAMIDLLSRARPPPQDLTRCIPDGLNGNQFLNRLGAHELHHPFGASVDEVLLARDPTNVGALLRDVDRDYRAHRLDDVRRHLDVILQAHPENPVGYSMLARLLLSEGDVAGAEQLIRTGEARATEVTRPDFLHLRASVQTARHDGPGMRRTMAELLDDAGADPVQRVELLGELGRHESELQNDALALSAFERAEAMAYPEHPYLRDILGAASRLGDTARVRGACNELDGSSGADDSLRALCHSMMRRADSEAGSAFVRELGDDAGLAPAP